MSWRNDDTPLRLNIGVIPLLVTYNFKFRGQKDLKK